MCAFVLFPPCDAATGEKQGVKIRTRRNKVHRAIKRKGPKKKMAVTKHMTKNGGQTAAADGNSFGMCSAVSLILVLE